MTENLYQIGQPIRHLERGTVYVIVRTPSENDLLEASGEPFYAYTLEDNREDMRTWHRAKSEVEDPARFEALALTELEAIKAELIGEVAGLQGTITTLRSDLKAVELREDKLWARIAEVDRRLQRSEEEPEPVRVTEEEPPPAEEEEGGGTRG